MNNPTAFPCNTENVSTPGAACMEYGMTIRDYCAAHVLAGIVANPNFGGDRNQAVGAAFAYADIFLAKREGEI